MIETKWNCLKRTYLLETLTTKLTQPLCIIITKRDYHNTRVIIIKTREKEKNVKMFLKKMLGFSFDQKVTRSNNSNNNNSNNSNMPYKKLCLSSNRKWKVIEKPLKFKICVIIVFWYIKIWATDKNFIVKKLKYYKTLFVCR